MSALFGVAVLDSVVEDGDAEDSDVFALAGHPASANVWGRR